MQGKDPFLVLLGVVILGVTFFFCGEGAVKPPPPVALQSSAATPPPAPQIIEPPPSSPAVPAVSAAAVLKKKIDELLIGNTIAFRLNSAILLPEGKSVLNNVAAILQEDPTVACEVGGHTDNVGPEQSNWVLSEQRAKAVVVGQLLTVLDDLDRARTHGDLDSGPLKSVADKLTAALHGLGLSSFGDEGEDFDPSVHEAVQHEGDGSNPVIGTVMRRGYRLGEQLLRHALVGVVDAASPSAVGGDTPPNTGDTSPQNAESEQ